MELQCNDPFEIVIDLDDVLRLGKLHQSQNYTLILFERSSYVQQLVTLNPISTF